MKLDMRHKLRAEPGQEMEDRLHAAAGAFALITVLIVQSCETVRKEVSAVTDQTTLQTGTSENTVDQQK